MKKGTRSEPLRVWVTTELKSAIERLAARDKRSVSTWITIVLEKAIGAEVAEKPKSRKS